MDVYTDNNIQLLTWFEDNNSFVRSKDGSVAQTCRLRTTDPFDGPIKVPLSEKSVHKMLCHTPSVLFSKLYSSIDLMKNISIHVRQVSESR